VALISTAFQLPPLDGSTTAQSFPLHHFFQASEKEVGCHVMPVISFKYTLFSVYRDDQNMNVETVKINYLKINFIDDQLDPCKKLFIC